MTGPWPEKGQFIWKCFTFAGDRPVFNNKHICPTISSETVINCPAGTPMPKRARCTLSSFQTFGTSFYGPKKQTLSLQGGFVLPLATGKKKRRIPQTIAPSFISIALKIFLSTLVILRSGHAPTRCTAGEADNENTSWQK